MPVVDASIVVDWVAPDAGGDTPARRLLARLVRDQATVLAPRLMLQETANALLTGVRRGRWDGVAADRAFDVLMRMPVEIADGAEDMVRAWELSRRYDEHPISDLVYVALAERLGERFLTADERLRAKLVGRNLGGHED